MFQISSAERCALYDTVTFEGPPKMEQVLWPAHCVQESWGAQLHQDLKVHPKGKVIHKGINPEVDSYSAFFGKDKDSGQQDCGNIHCNYLDNAKLGKTSLEEMIREEECCDVFVCGIATDVCVGNVEVQ